MTNDFYVRYSVSPERATLTLSTNWWKFRRRRGAVTPVLAGT